MTRLASTVLGPFFTDAIFELRGTLEQKWVSEFVNRLAIHFGFENELNIDERILSTAAFGDILENVLIKDSKTRSEWKIVMFNKVLVDHIAFDTGPDKTVQQQKVLRWILPRCP